MISLQRLSTIKQPKEGQLLNYWSSSGHHALRGPATRRSKTLGEVALGKLSTLQNQVIEKAQTLQQTLETSPTLQVPSCGEDIELQKPRNCTHQIPGEENFCSDVPLILSLDKG